MSFLETSHVADGPFGSSDPLADIVEYFQTNGYEVVQSTRGPRPAIMTWKAEEDEADDEASRLPETPAQDTHDEPGNEADDEAGDEADDGQEIIVRTQLRRGNKGASIWSSNMAELLSDVDIKLIGNSIRFAYTVETTLQRFNDDDNAFWAHEAKQAIRVATGGKAIDWRDNEAVRVSRQQKDIIMIGVQLAFIAAILVAVAYFAFDRM